jgi:hypothetical protein
MKKLDPAVILALVMLFITLAVMGLLLASRSCIRQTKELFAGIDGASSQAGAYRAYAFGEAKPLPPQEYVAFEDLVRGLDLGTGVTVGMSEDEVRRVLGNPFTSARLDSSRIQLMYNLPHGCEGPGEKQRTRTRSGFKAMVNMAMLMVTIRDGAAESLSVSFMPVSARDGWPFLTLGGKELALCTPADVRAFFGEPTDTLEDMYDTWHYRLAQADEAVGKDADNPDSDDGSVEGGEGGGSEDAAEAADAAVIPPGEEPLPAEAAPTGRRVAVKVDYFPEKGKDYIYEIELTLNSGE